MTGKEIELTIRRLLRARRAGGSICPSEVARALDPVGWRARMGDVRRIAALLAAKGEIVVTQRGMVVDPIAARGPIRIASADVGRTSYAALYRGVDFRRFPERYRIGRGEEGVLIAEPYKSELLPLWRFATPSTARASADALWGAFVAYRRARDFVGMDMARKYLQMGCTRARRYAHRRSGRKFEASDVAKRRSQRTQLPLDPDPVKAESARIFYEAWQRAERDRVYGAWRRRQAPPRRAVVARR